MSSAGSEPRPSRWGFIERRVRDAVQRVARVDPNPTDPFRGLYVSDDLAVALTRTRSGPGLDERLALAAERLELDALDATVLAVCAAPELDPRFGRLYAYLHDDVTRKLASPRLVARLLEGEGVRAADVLACFAASARLRAGGAIRLQGDDVAIPLAERGIKLSDRLAAFLLGSRLDEQAGSPVLRRLDLPEFEIGRGEPIERLRLILGHDSNAPVLVAGEDAAIALAVAAESPLLLADVQCLVDESAAREAILAAALDGRLLAFIGLEDLPRDTRPRVAAALAGRPGRKLLCAPTREAALALGREMVSVHEIPPMGFAERLNVWSAHVPATDAREAASKFRLSVAQVRQAAEAARLQAKGDDVIEPRRRHLDLGARQASATRLGELAQRLEPEFGWADLVLPTRQLEVLRSISGYLRHRDLVLSEWGYGRAAGRAQGIKALFAGESGTGKTLAAQVLAHELGLDLYRIDLATVVSKYIGETEKNLNEVFDAAEGSNAILFFDEADALFGRRSEVRDAHDRYANIEVAYLLQKMEAYPGAVILATNLRQNLDEAFLRRLDFVVDFPFPDAPERARIWRLLLPAAAPVADDLDVEFLAEQFRLSGGAIRNCSVAAAFLAADDGGTITMDHLVRAVALEYGKLGRLTLEADFERFHSAIRAGISDSQGA
jgi:ATPase family associated with various cellular activities (AAA)